jgi:hypothetical protein
MALVFLSLSLMSSAAHAALVNPGFELGNFTGWTVNNVGGAAPGVNVDGALIPGADAPFPPVFVNVRSGNFAAFAVVANTNGEYLSLSQQVNIAAAGNYLTGFFMGNDSQNAFGIDNAIDVDRLAIFVDGVNVGFDTRFPGNNFPTGSTPADMFEFSSNAFFSAGLHTVEFRISGSGTSRAGISVDDFFLNAPDTPQVPAPATLLRLGRGLAGAGLARSLRRN